MKTIVVKVGSGFDTVQSYSYLLQWLQKFGVGRKIRNKLTMRFCDSIMVRGVESGGSIFGEDIRRSLEELTNEQYTVKVIRIKGKNRR